MKWSASLVLCLLSAFAWAQEQPLVRVEVSPPEVTVGESAELRITVLVPTWFPRPPVFPNFEVANAITRLPPDSSYPTSERIGRDTWSGIVRNYRIYPLSAATYRLDGLTMNVTWANPGAEAAVVEIAVPEIVLRGVVPTGAEGLDPYVAGNSLTLTREIDGDVENLEAGDALVVRHIAELEGLPAIFIPPVSRLPETPGISVYADEPVVEDGDVARRVEQFTLVFDAGGEFSLQETALEWWNLESQTRETASLPALAVVVAGPAIAAATETSAASNPRSILVIGVTAAVLMLLAYRYLGRFRAKRAVRQREYLASEEYAFRQFKRATSQGSPADAYARMTDWLQRLPSRGGLREFVQQYGSIELQQLADVLARSLYTDEQLAPDLQALYTQAAAARTAFHAAQGAGTDLALPPINPVR